MARSLSDGLIERLLQGDRLAAARLITAIEQSPRDAAEVVRRIHPRTGRAHIVGITGAPGAGKSTLVDTLIDLWRKNGKTVGVIAIDPSSPFTGGALLGDRIRMQKRSTDKQVFIRSMGSRGHLGGLASATADAVKVLDAMGKDVILIETVGVGQAEVDVVKVADTTVVVLVPGMGDEIQSIKAGIMEIADIFVVNKADRDGADKTVAEVEMNLMMGLGSEDPKKRAVREAKEAGHHAGPQSRAKAFLDEDAVHRAERRVPRVAGKGPKDAPAPTTGDSRAFFEELLATGVWYPPVAKTVADKGQGVAEVVDLVDRHLAFLDAEGGRARRRRARAEREVLSLMKEKLVLALEETEHLSARFWRLVEDVAERRVDPHGAAEALLAEYQAQGTPARTPKPV